MNFASHQSVIDIEFWAELSHQILYEFYLTKSNNTIYATYLLPNKQNKTISNSTQLSITAASLTQPSYLHCNTQCCSTAEQFQSYDTQSLTQQYKHKLWTALCNNDVQTVVDAFVEFILVNYNDLKQHIHHYILCVPQIVLPSDMVQFNITQSQPVDQYVKHSNTLNTLISQIQKLLHDHPCPYFLIVQHQLTGQFGYNTLGQTEYYTVHQFTEYNTVLQQNDMRYNKLIFGCIDTVNDATVYTHLLRNLFAFIAMTAQLTTAQILLFRDYDTPIQSHASTLLSLGVQTSDIKQLQHIPVHNIKIVGWERNKFNKVAPKQVDLGRLMNPVKLAESSINLNLQLMKWRLLPDVKLDTIQSTKCLLLGAGTLGCNVARCLLGWGILNITLVDNGCVSYSNPVRQSLFTYADCINGGKIKATAAADALKLIYPNINAVGINMTIPMAGHVVNETELQSTIDNINQLTQLIQSHDIVFLLTDSRESRWLPTVLCKSLHKLCINTALGFDQYVVMRHGNIQPDTNTQSNNDIELGCYFCNDVIAPVNSLKDRTLDQQCTVTRPGISYIASADAVELAVATLHHPLQQYAPAINTETEPLMCGFGTLPHQIRGFLSRFEQKLVVGHAFQQCVACSHSILNEYKQRGNQFILDVLNKSSEHLESLSGLTLMKHQAEQMLSQPSMGIDDMNEEEDDW